MLNHLKGGGGGLSYFLRLNRKSLDWNIVAVLRHYSRIAPLSYMHLPWMHFKDYLNSNGFISCRLAVDSPNVEIAVKKQNNVALMTT